MYRAGLWHLFSIKVNSFIFFFSVKRAFLCFQSILRAPGSQFPFSSSSWLSLKRKAISCHAVKGAFNFTSLPYMCLVTWLLHGMVVLVIKSFNGKNWFTRYSLECQLPTWNSEAEANFTLIVIYFFFAFALETKKRQYYYRCCCCMVLAYSNNFIQ